MTCARKGVLNVNFSSFKCKKLWNIKTWHVETVAKWWFSLLFLKERPYLNVFCAYSIHNLSPITFWQIMMKMTFISLIVGFFLTFTAKNSTYSQGWCKRQWYFMFEAWNVSCHNLKRRERMVLLPPGSKNTLIIPFFYYLKSRTEFWECP